jgi:hypothetical protein
MTRTLYMQEYTGAGESKQDAAKLKAAAVCNNFEIYDAANPSESLIDFSHPDKNHAVM